MTEFRVPDALGHFVGWRAWTIADAYLVSDHAGRTERTIWYPGEAATARCLRHGDHRAPDESCTCGFYAVKTRDYLVRLGTYHWYSADRPVAIGQVGLTGKVIPAAHGWRAEQAWPISLHVPHIFWRLAAVLQTSYEPHGVVIELDNTLSEDSAEQRVASAVTGDR